MNAQKTQVPALLEQRQRLLQEMQSIDRLRRGSLSRQFFKSRGADAPATHGPYYVLQGFFQGQKFSERVPADQAPHVQAQVQNYRRFQTLAEEFVTVCDQITRQESQASKKNSSRRRSPRPDFKKPKPS